MSAFEPARSSSHHPHHHHHENKAPAPLPETVVVEEGSAKRNIVRRRQGSGKSKGYNKSAVDIDDGSNYVEVGGALDEHDPNFDSEVC